MPPAYPLFVRLVGQFLAATTLAWPLSPWALGAGVGPGVPASAVVSPLGGPSQTAPVTLGVPAQPVSSPLGTPRQAVPVVIGSPALTDLVQRSLDDPRAALAHGRRQMVASVAAADRNGQFWLRLGLADALLQTDRETEAHAELKAAAELVDGGPSGQRQRLWLALYQQLVDTAPGDMQAFRARQAWLREGARSHGDDGLLCSIDMVDAVVHVESDARDEAWSALETVERCGARLGDLGLQTYALGTMGLLAARIGVQLEPQAYFERAIKALGTQPARYKRAWLLDDLGWALMGRDQLDEARQRFEQTLALSRELGDVSGVMRGHEGLAEVLLRQKDGAGALRHARESLRLGGTQGMLYRPVTAQTQVVEALALMKGPGLAQEIEQLRGLAVRDTSPRTGALVAMAAARGYRALGRFDLAYAELERYLELFQVEERARRDSEAQRLQVRYETALREAENSELRRAAEGAQHELLVRKERQRVLVAAVIALLMALAGGTWYFTQALRRRRRLADLALRDELTGLPNRRAVRAFAHEQFKLAQRLQLPFSVALIDLDHFKQINDTHGHACGDRALQAFGVAAERILRGQDRIGRWGGEEWLLVIPGARAEELRTVFERLRGSLAEQLIPGLPMPHHITFSMGVAERHDSSDSPDALIAEADRQLYRAKAQGRDTLCGHMAGETGQAAVVAMGRAA
jgi:diguanylate cyclase (GGDEF)-like protein